MNAIDEIFTQYHFYGHRRIGPELKEEYGIDVGKKRIISLMKEIVMVDGRRGTIEVLDKR